MADIDRSIQAFDPALRALGAGAAGPAADLRERGLATFRRLGVPSRRVEDWKFTDLRRLLTRQEWQPVDRQAAMALVPDLPEALVDGAHRIVFVDGVMRGDLSDLPAGDGIRVASLADRLAAGDDWLASRLGAQVRDGDHAVIALNAALMDDGLVLALDDGAVLDRAVEIIWLASDGGAPRAWHPRSVIALGTNARATVIERFVGGSDACLANHVHEIDVAEGAELRLYRIQEAGAKANLLTHDLGSVAKDARLKGFGFDTGAMLARHEIDVALTGAGADAHFGGVYMGRDRQHLDNTLRVRHDAPNGTSRQVYKGVLAGRARGVFQGRIQVARAAQKTDAHQLHKGLLLDRGAEVDAKPELEIFADDVKCSHGATVGELDRAALFYLRSRGVPEHRARALLIEAFLDEALDEVPDATVRAALAGRITKWMGALGDQALEAA